MTVRFAYPDNQDILNRSHFEFAYTKDGRDNSLRLSESAIIEALKITSIYFVGDST